VAVDPILRFGARTVHGFVNALGPGVEIYVCCCPAKSDANIRTQRGHEFDVVRGFACLVERCSTPTQRAPKIVGGAIHRFHHHL
jgi:hypothetical protein